MMTHIEPSTGDKRTMLRHFLAALAYRTQKALRNAPTSFGEFKAGQNVRTPTRLVRHMTNVLGYARTFFIGGRYHAEPLEDCSPRQSVFTQCWKISRNTLSRMRRFFWG